MAHMVEFCNCSNPRNAVNKTFVTVDTRECTIVYPCDVLHPTIKILGGHVSANSVKGLFGRNYWIVSQTLTNGVNLVELVCDALSSWADNINNTAQFVTRSSRDYDTTLNDNIIIPNKPQTHVLACNGSAFGNSLGTDRCYIITLK